MMEAPIQLGAVGHVGSIILRPEKNTLNLQQFPDTTKGTKRVFNCMMLALSKGAALRALQTRVLYFSTEQGELV